MWITRCHLILHDTVYFATREIGTLYETERYIHNYALSYSLFNDSLIQVPYFCNTYKPNYAADLEKLNNVSTYITAARPICYDYMLTTWKMAQDRYRLFSVKFGAVNPATGQRTTNFPINVGRVKELAPESEFEFFVISLEAIKMPHWVRLGKWMSKAEVLIKGSFEVESGTGPFISACPINPLDLGENRLLLYDLISMPPVSLVVNARIDGHFYKLPGGTQIPAGMKYSFPSY
jgi:CRISPR-associated protein Csc1